MFALEEVAEESEAANKAKTETDAMSEQIHLLISQNEASKTQLDDAHNQEVAEHQVVVELISELAESKQAFENVRSTQVTEDQGKFALEEAAEEREGAVKAKTDTDAVSEQIHL